MHNVILKSVHKKLKVYTQCTRALFYLLVDDYKSLIGTVTDLYSCCVIQINSFTR